jgi:phage shock protein A
MHFNHLKTIYSVSSISQISESFESLADSILQQKSELQSQLKKQSQAMDKVRDTLAKSIKTAFKCYVTK